MDIEFALDGVRADLVAYFSQRSLLGFMLPCQRRAPTEGSGVRVIRSEFGWLPGVIQFLRSDRWIPIVPYSESSSLDCDGGCAPETGERGRRRRAAPDRRRRTPSTALRGCLRIGRTASAVSMTMTSSSPARSK